jgi:hypothetical protein
VSVGDGKMKRVLMRKMISVVLIVSMMPASAMLNGCSSDAKSGTLIGAGVGALAGQAIGGSTSGTLIGAGVGAGVGYVVGNERDKKK